MKGRETIMLYKTNIINKMKDYFQDDKKRIEHALQVTNYAEKLIRLYNKNSINPEVIIYAAILHDIGIKNAETKYNSCAGKYQEIEGPPVAKKILSLFPISKSIIDEVCTIIGNHHSPGLINTVNFKILYDADWLVNLPQIHNLNDKKKEEIGNIIEKLYLTNAGKKLAKDIFID